MLVSNIEVEQLTDAIITKLLFSDIEDDGANGNCIFVAGSSKATQSRLPRALELYKQGRADKILFSGGVKWDENEDSESVALKKEAMANGIPENNILLEDQSLHTLENVLASLLVLDREFHLYKIKRLLIVTSSYHMKRLYLTLKTYMPDWIQFTLCPADDLAMSKENWFSTEISRQRVLIEARKLVTYVKQGALRDIEIDI
ncbi:YdcF family protein [Robertmurraya sp. Marseille-Q9965]